MTGSVFHRQSTSEEGHQLVFDVDALLALSPDTLPGFQKAYSEFIDYKTESADLGNIPAPENHIQMEYASVVDLFGKDKPNHFPKPGAKKEKLHHVHVFDGKTDQELDAWVSKAQSRRVCDTLLFYSYFEFQGIHHFFILQFVLDPDGHDFQNEDGNMKNLVERASAYRAGILSGQI